MSGRGDDKNLGPDLFEDPIEHPEAPREGLRQSILDTLVPETRFRGFERRVAEFIDLDEAATRELLQEAADGASGEWREPLPGVRLLDFDGGERVREAHCGLVSMEPSAAFPRHDHSGHEWAFVLQGEGVEEGTGRVWKPGDLVHSEAGSTHEFRSVGREPFVFVVVLEAPIKVHKGSYIKTQARRLSRRARS